MVCLDCGRYVTPIHDSCPHCGSENIVMRNEDQDDER